MSGMRRLSLYISRAQQGTAGAQQGTARHSRAQQGTAGHSRCVPGLSAFLAMHSPVMAPHFQIGVGILNDHQPDTRPEEEASPKDRRIPAHNKCCSGFLL